MAPRVDFERALAVARASLVDGLVHLQGLGHRVLTLEAEVGDPRPHVGHDLLDGTARFEHALELVVHQIAFHFAPVSVVVPPLDADGARLHLIDVCPARKRGYQMSMLSEGDVGKGRREDGLPVDLRWRVEVRQSAHMMLCRCLSESCKVWSILSLIDCNCV